MPTPDERTPMTPGDANRGQGCDARPDPHCWYRLDLGDALVAAPRQHEIEELVTRARSESPEPGELALYAAWVSDGRLHCELRLYFTPAAAAIARACGAVPCVPPDPDGVSRIAGGGRR